jgi:3-oxoacyl-[acyl-carrier-protein] synthase II
VTDAVDHRGRPRVAVTGIGLKTPAGTDRDAFWSTLLAGRSTAAPITRFDASALPVTFGCEVSGFDPVAYLGPKEARRMDRTTQLGFAAAKDALDDAGDVGADPARCAVVAGTGIGGLITMEDGVQTVLTRGPSRISPFFVPMMMANASAGVIAMQLGWTGPNLCVATACAASANAVGEAARLVREGSADVAMAGGAESAITPVALAAFSRMGALSTRNDEPGRASRPFDVDRDGFVMGEGSAYLVLERLDRARTRGARVYAELAGYGRNSDAYHITAPSPGGSGAAACMHLALDDAGLDPGDIGHVNAHGTSTALNDAAEAEAVRKVFGDTPPPIMSVKGVTGHLIGAAGATESVAAILATRDGIVPPTANLEQVGDDIGLDVIGDSPREVGPRPAISNSFGFGGHNASLVFRPAA